MALRGSKRCGVPTYASGNKCLFPVCLKFQSTSCGEEILETNSNPPNPPAGGAGGESTPLAPREYSNRTIMVHIRENVLLAPFTVYSIGGPARYFVEARTGEEIREAVAFGRENGVPFFILGAGSNILVSDKGFLGIVIRVLGGSVSIEGGAFRVDAGVKMAAAAAEAASAGLAGFEWAVGIPGTVGGSVRGNAGCFGGEIRQVLESVQVLEITNHKSPTGPSPLTRPSRQTLGRAIGQITNKTQNPKSKTQNGFRTFSLNNSECEFGYRHSIFKAHPEWIILSVTFSLAGGDADMIRDRIISITRARTEKQDIGTKSCGCIFKNVSWDVAGGKESFLGRFPEYLEIVDLPNIPAAFLIDRAGLKGERAGNTVISPKHANFFVNDGGASAEDVRRLIRRVEDVVRRAYGITLEPEIQYVGFEGN